MSASCFLQPPRNGSSGQVPVLEHETSGGHSHNHSGNGIREWSGNRCMFAIPREFPFPFPFPQNSLGAGGVQSLQYDFPAKKQETEQVVRIRMEEETGRKKQEDAWGVALLVSA